MGQYFFGRITTWRELLINMVPSPRKGSDRMDCSDPTLAALGLGHPSTSERQRRDGTADEQIKEP